MTTNPLRVLCTFLAETFQTPKKSQLVVSKQFNFIAWQKQDPAPEQEAMLRARIRRRANSLCHYGNKASSAKLKY